MFRKFFGSLDLQLFIFSSDNENLSLTIRLHTYQSPVVADIHHRFIMASFSSKLPGPGSFGAIKFAGLERG